MVFATHISLVMFTVYLLLFLNEKRTEAVIVYLSGVLSVAIIWSTEECDVVLCIMASTYVGFQLLIVSVIVILQSLNLKQNAKSKRKTIRVH